MQNLGKGIIKPNGSPGRLPLKESRFFFLRSYLHRFTLLLCGKIAITGSVKNPAEYCNKFVKYDVAKFCAVTLTLWRKNFIINTE